MIQNEKKNHICLSNNYQHDVSYNFLGLRIGHFLTIGCRVYYFLANCDVK